MLKKINNNNLALAKFDYIDSLRGIAILMVVLVHTSQSIPGLPVYIKAFCDYGQMGVQLFFLISAYTLCLSLDKNECINSKDIIVFYIKRFFRIAPLYYLGIILYFFISYISIKLNGHKSFPGPEYSISNICSNILFIHNFNYNAYDGIVPGGWSIGAEMIFYLMFPFIYILYKKCIKKKLLSLYIIPLTIILISYFFINTFLPKLYFYLFSKELKPLNNSFLYFNIFNQIGVFFIGISLFFYNKLSKRKEYDIAYLKIIFLVLFFFSFLVFHYYFNISVMPIMASLAFLISFQIFYVSNKIGNNVLKKIGILSFSIYLFHFIFAWPLSSFLVKKLVPYFSSTQLLVICYFITISLTSFVALFSQRIVEKPGILLGIKISKIIKQNR